MCLIAYSPLRTFIPLKYLDSAYNTNSHGFGLMFPENGRVKVIKGMYPVDQIKHLYKRYKHENVALHFRMATAGIKGTMNCHPFQLLSLDEDGMDLWMMHNGTFFEYKDGPNGESDTAMFAKHLAWRMRNDGFSLSKPECVQELEDNASWNKLLFMSGTGDVTIINEGGGDSDNGCWYSYAVKNRFNNYPTRSNYTNYGTALGDDDQENLDLVEWWEKQFNKNRAVTVASTKVDPDFEVTEREQEDMERGTDEERVQKYAAKCADMMDFLNCSFYEAAEHIVRDEDFRWEYYGEIEVIAEEHVEQLKLRAQLRVDDEDWGANLHGFNDNPMRNPTTDLED